MPIWIDCDEDFDEEFEKYENIKLWPFIGDGYTSAQTKIMVLGESPYWEKNEPPPRESTRYNLYDYVENIKENGSTETWTHAKGFRNTAAMITGKGLKESDEKWRELVFYNFYQFIIGSNAKDKLKLSQEKIILSQKAFFDVIKILSPDFIIAWGLSYMYKSWLPQEGRILLDEERKIYKYGQFPNTVIWHIHHPSSSYPPQFDLEHWQAEYRKIVNYDIRANGI